MQVVYLDIICSAILCEPQCKVTKFFCHFPVVASPTGCVYRILRVVNIVVNSGIDYMDLFGKIE